MTGKLLIQSTYQLLNDTDSRRSDSVPFYDKDVLVALLAQSRDGVFEYLLDRSQMGNRPRTPLLQRYGRITISKMLKFCPAIQGTQVPPDFWRLICGFDGNGQYVPPRTIERGEALAFALRPAVWVRLHAFNGTAVTAAYWAKPSEAIADTITPLTEFPDGFYNAVITLTALEAIMQEDLDVKSRYAELEAIFMQQIQSLR